MLLQMIGDALVVRNQHEDAPPRLPPLPHLSLRPPSPHAIAMPGCSVAPVSAFVSAPGRPPTAESAPRLPLTCPAGLQALQGHLARYAQAPY